MTVVVLDSLIGITEAWVKSDPRWQQFLDSFGAGWDLKFLIADYEERFCWDRKIIYLPMFRWPDPKFRAAHAAAHVKRHLGKLEFSPEDCAYADAWAVYSLGITDNGCGKPPIPVTQIGEERWPSQMNGSNVTEHRPRTTS